MHTYRFRIQSDENEEFLMDIELKANQTFLDFHNAIKAFANINTNEFASFFICDDKWRKKTEITLVEVEIEDKNTNEKKIIKEMKDVVINSVIDNPHQKFLYIYDFLNVYTFYIELTHIKEVNEKDTYPKLVKIESEINLNKQNNLNDIFDEDDDYEDTDKETFFGEDTDLGDLDNLETDMFYGKPDEF